MTPMKKLLTLFVIFAVVGFTCSAQHLDVGDRFPSHVNLVTAYIAHDFTPIVQETVSYNPSLGTLDSVVSNTLERLSRSFRPISGKERGRYQIGVSATSDLETNGWAYVSTAEYTRSFTHTETEGGWTIPRGELSVQLSYQSYIAYHVVGVKSVAVFVDGAAPDYSRNGVSDPTCDLINRQDGLLYFPERFVTGKSRGSIVLYFNEAKTEYERYSLETGDLIEITRRGRPQRFLHIGNRIENHIETVSAGISLDGTPLVQDAVEYHRNLGTPAAVASGLLQRVARDFVPPAGRETSGYRVWVLCDSALGTPASYRKTVNLVQTAGGWSIPQNELQITSVPYQPYIAYSVPGVKSVSVFVDGERPDHSRNGVSDPTCNLYDAQDGLLHFPERQVTAARGTMVLYFDQARTEEDTYDLSTGDLLASTRRIPTMFATPVGRGQIELMIVGGTNTLHVERSNDLRSWREAFSVSANTRPQRQVISMTNNKTGFFRVRSGL
jgi:hypothetical protein